MEKTNIFIPTQTEEISFEVYWKNRCTATVHSRGAKVYVEITEKNPVKRLFPNMALIHDQVNEILKTRCWDSGRPDIRELLAIHGLTDYVPLDTIRRTHGVSYNDFLWIKFPGGRVKSRRSTCEERLGKDG